ncbi:MAG TPA: hypothetical protein VEV44_15805 [Pseudoneobacillus sp.]|nr:hypothetical protein [Pseudoneobacillus sp.]
MAHAVVLANLNPAVKNELYYVSDYDSTEHEWVKVFAESSLVGMVQLKLWIP